MSINKEPTGRRARRLLKLDPFNWVMQHKESQQRINADSLSRRPQNPEPRVENNTSQETAAQVNAAFGKSCETASAFQGFC